MTVADDRNIHRTLKWSAVVFAIGFGSAAVFTYAHLLPTFWSDFQDSYISLPHTNMTWFSWLSAVAEIGTGIVFGFVGVRAVRDRRFPSDRAPVARLDPVR